MHHCQHALAASQAVQMDMPDCGHCPNAHDNALATADCATPIRDALESRLDTAPVFYLLEPARILLVLQAPTLLFSLPLSTPPPEPLQPWHPRKEVLLI